MTLKASWCARKIMSSGLNIHSEVVAPRYQDGKKSNKRGKIPQSDWPAIMARYEAGRRSRVLVKTYDVRRRRSVMLSVAAARNSEGDASVAVDADTRPQ